MSFIDPITRFKIATTCYMCGHDMAEWIKDRTFFHERKKNGKTTRNYFHGNFRWCRRFGCQHEEFEGSRTPIKKTFFLDGIEHEEVT